MILDFFGLVLLNSFFKVLSSSINSILFVLANFIWKSKAPFKIKTFHGLKMGGFCARRVDYQLIILFLIAYDFQCHMLFNFVDWLGSTQKCGKYDDDFL